MEHIFAPQDLKTVSLVAVGVLIAGALLLGAASVVSAQTPSPAASAAVNPTVNMTDGEVRKIDKANAKLTIKHGTIASLDMPGMTMVFGVKDPSWLDQLKVGSKILFTVVEDKGRLLVTDIQNAK